jgi:hypothetical protein
LSQLTLHRSPASEEAKLSSKKPTEIVATKPAHLRITNHPASMSSELSPGRRPRLSLENFDPSNTGEPILNSPRSVEACRRAGILAKDLVFRYADSFGDKFVSEEIKEMRARHYEEMRVMKLKMVKDEFLKVSAACFHCGKVLILCSDMQRRRRPQR